MPLPKLLLPARYLEERQFSATKFSSPSTEGTSLTEANTTETNPTETPTTETAAPAPVNPCLRELTIEIPADVVKQETDSLVKRYAKVARIPGFRAGKVPPTIVRQRFADDIKNEVVEALVPKYFREAAEKQNLEPVSQPRVTDMHLHDGEPLKFTASFEILPDFTLRPYDDIKPETIDTTVSDDDVEKALNNLREQHATYAAVEEDRPLGEGDFAVVGFKGTPKESEQDADSKPVEVDEIMVQIGDSNTLPEFNENLRGAKAGEQRTFDVKYADDFSDKRLAGKSMTYEVNVKGIKTKSVPELNDDFAKELGADLNSIDELRTRLRDNMTSEKQHEAEHQGKDKIVEQLVNRNDFPVPESMLDQQIDLRLERGLRALAAQGMRTEDMKRMDFARLRAGQRDAALREVRASLILEQIADQEKIEVSDEEFDHELEALAAQSKQSVEEIRKRLSADGGLDRIRHRIRNEKTLDHLYRSSA